MTKRSGRIRSGVIKASQIARLRYYYQLRSWFPNERNSIKRNGYFHVYGYLRANIQSALYEIEFRSRGRRIMVIVHGLKFPGKIEDIPHIFLNESSADRDEVSLCLYRNKINRSEFIFGDSLKVTIIPWIQEWLYFYELFLITGKWYGNGEHPEPEKEKKSNT